jgi:DNA-binding CsgD family transcriptional regulator
MFATANPSFGRSETGAVAVSHSFVRRARSAVTAAPRGLTSREREVLFWLGYGKSNAEIGLILGITPATVGKHLERIYPKLGVENRTAAASFASELTGRLAT